MSNLVPFGQSQAPAYIAQTGMTPDQIKAMAAAAAIGTGGGGVDRISIKGARFRLVIGGTAQAPLPVVELDVAILRVNDGINKTWFASEWNPDADASPPDCSSDDGITPRADSPSKQSAACADCPKNEWGSHINPTTGAKGKACQDSKRMAIMAPGQDGRYASATHLFQLAVPPASLKDFGMLVKGLAAHTPPAAYNMVVVTLSFDPDASFPKLLFKPKRWLEQDEFGVINTLYNDDETKRICGLAEAQGVVLGAQATAQGAPQLAGQQPQQAAIQQQAAVQEPAPQAAATTGGWGGGTAQPVHQAAQQQAATPAASGWGGGTAQPAQQAAAQPQQAAQQQAAATPRVRGKASEGKARRTKEEIAEDAALDEADRLAAGAGQAAAQPQQQAVAGWGGGQAAAPAAQQAAAASGWGGQQAAAPAEQTTGAPNQPNVVGNNDAGMAFAGWDD